MSLNTTPRTWVASEVVTAAEMNTEIRDAVTGIQAAWTTFGSGASWTASTNPSLGNGTWAGRYNRIGKTIDFRIAITMGSTTTFGSGLWQLALPVTALDVNHGLIGGDAFDSSATGHFPVFPIYASTTLISVRTLPTTAGNASASVTGTVPFTWTTSDILIVQGRYEAA